MSACLSVLSIGHRPQMDLWHGLKHKGSERQRSLEVKRDRSAQIDDPETEQIKPFGIPLSDIPHASRYSQREPVSMRKLICCEYDGIEILEISHYGFSY